MQVRQIIKSGTFIAAIFALCQLNAQTDSTEQNPPADSSQIPVEEIQISDEIAAVEKTNFGSGFNIPDNWGIGLRIVNGHSTFTLPKKKLEFFIQHRFGFLSGGKEEFYGLDESNIRLGFDYGLLPKLTLGISRSNMGKMFNGYVKWGLTTQGDKSPVSATWFSDMSVSAAHPPAGLDPWYPSHRYKYTHQLMVSRVFGKQRLMLQVAPTLVHRNLVDSLGEPNDLALLSASLRLRLSRRLSITGEYNYIFNHDMRSQLQAAAGAGLEIYTGGHVFQLVFTNVSALNESQYMTMNNGDISRGDLRFGFNIVRRF